MKVRLIWVGRTRDAASAGWIEEYRKRIARFCPIDIVEVRDAPGRWAGRASREERDIASRIDRRGLVVRLDERGREVSSLEFAALVREALENRGEVTFLLGGPEGWDGSVPGAGSPGTAPARPGRPKAGRSDARKEPLAGSLLLSLSRLTLPHEMARVVLLEQLYRAFTIMKGLPYHR
jgi:23S rRNA (pseudouridine1915-N3)-methyltransferase